MALTTIEVRLLNCIQTAGGETGETIAESDVIKMHREERWTENSIRKALSRLADQGFLNCVGERYRLYTIHPNFRKVDFGNVRDI